MKDEEKDDNDGMYSQQLNLQLTDGTKKWTDKWLTTVSQNTITTSQKTVSVNYTQLTETVAQINSELMIEPTE